MFVVFPEPDGFEDLTAASASSLDFWDNPDDDADWGTTPDPGNRSSSSRQG